MSFCVYDAVLGSLTLRQVTRTAYNANGGVIAGRQSGALDPSQYYGGPADPMASFDSADVGGVLSIANIATAGLAVAAGTITIPFNNRANGGTFQSGSAHQTISGANGLIVPTGFSASQDDAAAIATLDCHFRTASETTDPTTFPVAINANVSLSAQAFTAQYAMGPVFGELNAEGSSTQITGVQQITVNPGLSVQKARYNGHLFPTRIFITQRDPTIDLTFVDSASAYRFRSLYSALVSVTAFFRRRTDGGTFVADNSTSHCRFSFAAGITEMQSVTASGTDTGSVTVRIYGKALTATAGVAIA